MKTWSIFLLGMAAAAGAVVGEGERPKDPLLEEAPPLVVAGLPEAAEQTAKVISVERPADEAFFKEYSKELQTAMARVKGSLVCIQAGGGSGSGTVVSESGLILTAAHVVATPGTALKIVMPDGTKYDGEALGVDERTDAGMARIINPDGVKFQAAPLGDYSKLKVGDWVFAMGHSGGWDEKRGPVVRMGRVVMMEPTTVQSDCVLIGGDSGGPLFDLYGRLIGINSRVGMNVEFSMHVPVSVLIDNDELYRSGAVIRRELGGGLLGVVLEEADGLQVREVAADAPAAHSGLLAGDVILSVDGNDVTTVGEVREALAGRYVGERVMLRVKREGGDEAEVWVRLMSRPQEAPAPPAGADGDNTTDEKPDAAEEEKNESKEGE
ncbi:S1C family serine protease [Sulfuriroseicoccus oceanibius]|uniref:Trypsin-like peptidase domain-containing protein n=1 Tax=Sulfuriroseicoccus oceanibius TaxID=2707525 RepID=A0A6B3L797_9BACT|nr:trypsin-like peptidase domain-containing protein [Sulfuriroseicoccus oceanibius]QQL44376.1 trypsin-like peptidase domain-containing protein [Sulfuriroseicoccus oceanibius]